MAAGRATGGGADRRRDLDRVGHPRLPRADRASWTKDPAAERRADIRYYVADPELRKKAWRDRVERPMWDAEPNAGHRALAELESRAALHTLVTQNIDGLHQRAGSSPEIVVEIHGTAHEAKCLDCGWRGPMQETLDRVRAGEDDPPCLIVRRHAEVGHDLVRREPGRTPTSCARSRRRRTPTCSSPSALRSACIPRPRSPRSRCRTAPGSRSSTRSRRRSTRWPSAIVREQLGTVLPAIVAAVPVRATS